MSIADHFDHAPDASFVRDYDSGTARRQFFVSLLLLIVISVAATALGLMVRFEAPASASSEVHASLAPVAAPFAGHLR